MKTLFFVLLVGLAIYIMYAVYNDDDFMNYSS